jgi:hypothetical protein
MLSFDSSLRYGASWQPVRYLERSSLGGRIKCRVNQDKDFLEWREDQPLLSHGLGVLEAMKIYVQHMNLRSSELYEQQMREHKVYLHSAKPKDAEKSPEQSKEPEPSKIKAPDGTTMNILSPQIIPNTQNMSSPNPQNISSPPILDPPSQSSLTLPPPASLPELHLELIKNKESIEWART